MPPVMLVLLIMVANLPPVSTILTANLLPVSRQLATGINDTPGKFAIGVNNIRLLTPYIELEGKNLSICILYYPKVFKQINQNFSD